MVEAICAWYEAWTLSILHWYTSHPVLLASSLIGSVVLLALAGLIGVILLIRQKAISV